VSGSLNTVEAMVNGGSLVRRFFPVILVTVVAALLLVAWAPGSLSVVGSRWLSSHGRSIPHVELASEVTLALMAVITAVAIVFTVWKRPERRVHGVVASIGVATAYVASESAKVLFTQPRPCSRWVTATACPPAGDWSLPSNHATLAFGAVAAIAIVLGRVWITWAMIGLATIVALGRVLEGVHYVHDVALGAVLGATLPTLLVLLIDASRRRAGDRDPGTPHGPGGRAVSAGRLRPGD
jgi:membrane-associated phospholipid phosphatase